MFPALLFGVLACLSVFFWSILEGHRRDQLQLETDTFADQLGHRIHTWFDHRTTMVAHLGPSLQVLNADDRDRHALQIAVRQFGGRLDA